MFGTKPSDEPWYLWFKFILSIALAVFMPVCIVLGFRHAVIQWNSHSWPKTTMTITSAGDFADHGIVFQYEFKVGGKQYTGSTKTTETIVTQNQQSQLVRKYAVGTEHDLYYHPDDPGKYSVLQPGGNFLMQTIVGILAVLAWIGICFNVHLHYVAIFQQRFQAPQV